MKKKALVVIIILAVVLGAVSFELFEKRRESRSRGLRLSGHMEATETDLSFRAPGKISVIHFHEGDWIKIGDVVAELDAKELRDEVAVSRARIEVAKANLAKMLAGSRRQEIREAEAAVSQARADFENKQLDFMRNENLFKQKAVAARVRDRAEADYLVAKAVLHRAEEQYKLKKEGYRIEDIDAARAELEQAKANLELSSTRLGYAVLTSPTNGVVLVKPAEPGETAAVGSVVLTLGDLDDVWFEGYIPETDLAKIRYGQSATITTDTYPGRLYPGKVSFISSKAEFTPKSVETYKERISLVYRTKIRVANPEHELKPGMPAEAVIEYDGR